MFQIETYTLHQNKQKRCD